MTSYPPLAQPPRLASSLVNLFTSSTEAESILGDLLEEFSALASNRGTAFARRWYWRQTLKTIAHLFAFAFRVDPWWTVTAVVGGFCLLRLLGPLPERIIFAVLQRFQVYEHHFGIYVFFASYGIGIAHALRALLVGSLVAMVAKGREMVATLTLALILCAMLIVAWMYSINSHWTAIETLSWIMWQGTVPFSIVVGGVLARAFRSARRPA
jgi:hypothetical protein